MHSSVSHLVSRNCLPSAEEACVIRCIVSDSHANVKALTAEIEALQIAMDRTLSCRQGAQHRVEEYSALLSPIHQVPPELLAEIFISCLPTGEPMNMVPSSTVAPMLLCCVCSGWRQVAIQTPLLWRMGAFLPPQIEMAVLWISRSGSLPLKFFMCRLIRIPNTVRTPLLAEFMSTILSSIHHWAMFKIDLGTDGEYGMAMHGLGRYSFIAPWLHTVAIMRYGQEIPLPEWLITVIQSTPALHHLTIPTICGLSAVSYPHLTHIKVAHLDVWQALRVLHGCPGLLSCNFDICPANNTSINTASSGVPLTHQSLKSLSVDSSSPPEDVSVFFNNVTFPTLQSLMDTFWEHSDGFRRGPALLGFLSHSSCRLDHLYLRSLSVLEYLLAILEHDAVRHSLTHLTLYKLNRHVSMEPILSFLTVRPSHVSLPLLQSVHFDRSVRNFPDGTLATMIESRAKPSGDQKGVALRSEESTFELWLPQGHEEDILRIAAWCAASVET